MNYQNGAKSTIHSFTSHMRSEHTNAKYIFSVSFSLSWSVYIEQKERGIKVENRVSKHLHDYY